MCCSFQNQHVVMNTTKFCNECFRAGWPNGKALLSGGKDYGFESHTRRFCFAFAPGNAFGICRM